MLIYPSRLWAAFLVALAVVSALLGAVAIVLAAGLPHRPTTTRISLNLGGSVLEFIEDFSNARENNTRYVLDGLCISACTMITGEIPPENVCVTPYAKLAFHAAFRQGPLGEREFSPEGTELIWRIYPEWVHEYLRKQGWQGPDKDQPTLIWLEAPELLNHYKACK